MMNLKGYLRADEVAARLRVKTVNVYAWVRRGHLQRIEILPGRYVFAEAEVRRFAKTLPLRAGKSPGAKSKNGAVG